MNLVSWDDLTEAFEKNVYKFKEFLDRYSIQRQEGSELLKRHRRRREK